MSRQKLLTIVVLTFVLVVSCDKFTAPIKVVTYQGRYITAVRYSQLDTVAIAWDNYPPFCTYPANMWQANPYVR